MAPAASDVGGPAPATTSNPAVSVVSAEAAANGSGDVVVSLLMSQSSEMSLGAKAARTVVLA